MFLNTNAKYSILYFKCVFCIFKHKYIPSLLIDDITAMKQYGMKINKYLTIMMLHSRIIAYIISGFVF